MSNGTNKRPLSDSTSDSEQGPLAKIRKTTHQDKCHDAGTQTVEIPQRRRRPLTKYLLSTYRHELDRKEEEITVLEEFNWKLTNFRFEIGREKDNLEAKVAQLQRELDKAKANNHALTKQVEEMKFRLPENQDRVSTAHIRRRFRALDSTIAKFVDIYLVDEVRVLPFEYGNFSHLTRYPGPLLGDRTTRGLLFQAWIWNFMQTNIFARYSNFWAGSWGKKKMRQLDGMRAAMTDAADIAEHHRLRTEEINHLLTLVPSSKAEQIHDLAMEIFDFFFVELRTPHHSIYLADVVADLKYLLEMAGDLDLILRRSRADYTVELPSAGFLSWTVFDADTMKVTHYWGAGEEVVLVVSPTIYREGMTDGEGVWEETVIVKSRVVVGRGEEEDEIGVEEEERSEVWWEDIETWVMRLEEAEDEEDEEGALGEQSTCVGSDEG